MLEFERWQKPFDLVEDIGKHNAPDDLLMDVAGRLFVATELRDVGDLDSSTRRFLWPQVHVWSVEQHEGRLDHPNKGVIQQTWNITLRSNAKTCQWLHNGVMPQENHNQTMSQMALRLKLEVVLEQEAQLRNRRDDADEVPWPHQSEVAPYASSLLHGLNKQLKYSVDQALREARHTSDDPELVRAIETLGSILTRGRFRPIACFDVPHPRHLKTLVKRRPAYVPRNEASEGEWTHGSPAWQARDAYRQCVRHRKQYLTRVEEWNTAVATLRGVVADLTPKSARPADSRVENPTQPTPIVKTAAIENPTRQVSLSYAARKWFGMDYRTLKRSIEDGRIGAVQVGDRRWTFDLGDVVGRNPELDVDADPTLYSKSRTGR